MATVDVMEDLKVALQCQTEEGFSTSSRRRIWARWRLLFSAKLKRDSQHRLVQSLIPG